MADWLGGYSAEWSVYRVNPETWDDSGVVDGIVSVDVSRDGTDDVPLIETGTMQVDGEGLEDGSWCRVYMVASQDAPEKIAMATLLFERQSSRVEKGVKSVSARGRSVLQPVADRKIARGAFVPAGANGADYVARLLRECTPAPVSVVGSFSVVDDLVFDIGASYLDAVWQVLNAAGWCVMISGRGEITVCAKPTDPALELDRAHAGLLIPGVGNDFNIIDIPNRYYAVMDDETAVATNEREGSKPSYVERGRWVDKVDNSPTLIDGESLEHYAMRKLTEESTVLQKYDYAREFWPDVTVFSMVRATIANNGVEGDLRVLTQTLKCGSGVTVTETAGMEVVL